MSDSARYLAAINRMLWRTEPVSFQLKPAEWFMVVAAVQLACRHPDIAKTEQLPLLRNQLTRLAELLAAEDPALLELIEKGWDKREDVPSAKRN